MSQTRRAYALGLLSVFAAVATASSCSSSPDDLGLFGGSTGVGGDDSTGSQQTAASQGVGSTASATGSTSGSGGSSMTATASTSGSGGNGVGGASTSSNSSSTGTGGAAFSCATAAADRSNVGCDFWPTVVPNTVWSIFDFAAVVVNDGPLAATVTVTGGAGAPQTVMVAPTAATTVYLPWVPALKGADGDNCGNLPALPSTAVASGGAYHLVSDEPVAVYQFSAIEYAGVGGPPGHSWASCPGTGICASSQSSIGCFSFTNDASLLLPTSALSSTYRLTSVHDWTTVPEGAYFAITATQANTQVAVYVSSTGHVKAGGNIPDTAGGGIIKITLSNAGDVALLVSDGMSDLSGSLVKSSAPVQVISGIACSDMPQDGDPPACDHLEQTVLPAESLGKHYFVTVPTAPHAAVIGHVVRLVGDADGTTLSYPSGNMPPGAPLTLNAGQVVDLGQVSSDFEVSGNHEFAVATFMLGASLADPNDVSPNQLGDPSQSNAVPVEQYRTKYVFDAPTDYTESYVDIAQPMNAQVMVDGVAAPAPTAIGSSAFGVSRLKLGAGNSGAHLVTSNVPVSIQVIGYGSYTSYQYPGGLSLALIAPSPPAP